MLEDLRELFEAELYRSYMKLPNNYRAAAAALLGKPVAYRLVLDKNITNAAFVFNNMNGAVISEVTVVGKKKK